MTPTRQRKRTCWTLTNFVLIVLGILHFREKRQTCIFPRIDISNQFCLKFCTILLYDATHTFSKECETSYISCLMGFKTFVKDFSEFLICCYRFLFKLLEFIMNNIQAGNDSIDYLCDYDKFIDVEGNSIVNGIISHKPNGMKMVSVVLGYYSRLRKIVYLTLQLLTRNLLMSANSLYRGSASSTGKDKITTVNTINRFQIYLSYLDG